MGGFPEQTDVLDDLGFVLAVTKAGYRMRTAPGAVVKWRPRPTYRSVRRQFYLYARDTARGGFTGRIYSRTLIWDALLTTLLIWVVFVPGPLPWIILAAMLTAYLARQTYRGCFVTPGWRKLYRAPLILGIIHLGVITGIAAGLFMRISGTREKNKG